jgi:hypothetical protein
MGHRWVIVLAIGLFLCACAEDKAATESAAPAAEEKPAFSDPAYGGDIVTDVSGQIVKKSEEAGSERPPR